MSAAAADAAPAPVPKGKSHRRWVLALVVLASIVTLVSSLTIYVKRQALDSRSWSDTSAQLLQDKKVRDALSVYLVNQLYAEVDVKGQLQEILPKQTKSLAGPASALLRELAPRAASDILARPDVQTLWQDLNFRAHQELLTIIEGKTVGPVATTNGEVVLDLHPLVTQLADRLGVGGKVPPDAGRITVLKSGQLRFVQDTVKAVKVLTVFLVGLALILYAVAIRLAVGWRREVLRAIGWSLVIVGVLLLLVRHFVGNTVVDSLVTTQSVRPAAKDAWLIGSSLLADAAWAVILYGVAVVVAAWLAGPTGWATGARRWLAPVFKQRPGVVGGVVAFLYLLLLLWGPTRATRQWWGILSFAAVIGLGVWMLRRETLQEFPDAGTAIEWPDLRAGWSKLRSGSKGGGSAPPPA